MYGFRYHRLFDYVSVSWCAIGPARENGFFPTRPQVGKSETAPLSLPYDSGPLPGDSAPLNSINTAATRGGEEIHFWGWGGLELPRGLGPVPLKQGIQKIRGTETRPREVKSQVYFWRTTYLILISSL